jgi:hypothetical protein
VSTSVPVCPHIGVAQSAGHPLQDDGNTRAGGAHPGSGSPTSSTPSGSPGVASGGPTVAGGTPGGFVFGSSGSDGRIDLVQNAI